MGVCSCSQCQKWIDKTRPQQGWYSDYIGQAVVKVAKAVEKEFPDCFIVYLAYERYSLPPKKIRKLPDNIIVLLAQSRLATIDPEKRVQFIKLVRAWQELKPAGIAFCRYYLYGTNIIPVFIPHHIAKDIKLMKHLSNTDKAPILGEMHFTLQNKSSNWWFPLNEYVTGRALWNPDLDVDELLNDFYANFFGPAKDSMKSFFALLENAYLTAPQRTLYSVAFISKL